MIKLEKTAGFEKVSKKHQEIIEPIFDSKFSTLESFQKKISNISKELGKVGNYSASCIFVPPKEVEFEEALNGCGTYQLIYKHHPALEGLIQIGNVIY